MTRDFRQWNLKCLMVSTCVSSGILNGTEKRHHTGCVGKNAGNFVWGL